MAALRASDWLGLCYKRRPYGPLIGGYYEPAGFVCCLLGFANVTVVAEVGISARICVRLHGLCSSRSATRIMCKKGLCVRKVYGFSAECNPCQSLIRVDETGIKNMEGRSFVKTAKKVKGAKKKPYLPLRERVYGGCA